MPQGIVISHWSTVSLMIINNYRILELEYTPIIHPFLSHRTLRNSQTWKVWHHINITIRFIFIKNKLYIVPFITNTSYITNILCTELLNHTIHTNILRKILSLYYKWTSITPLLIIFKSPLRTHKPLSIITASPVLYVAIISRRMIKMLDNWISIKHQP